MSKYKYILYSESNGKRLAVFNEKPEPFKTFGIAFYGKESDKGKAFESHYQETYNRWQSNHITLEVDEIEADKVKQCLLNDSSLWMKHWDKCLNDYFKEGLLIDCLTINEGKAVFYVEEKEKECVDFGVKVFRNVQMCAKLELILRPEYLNTVFTWAQIRDAVMKDDIKVEQSKAVFVEPEKTGEDLQPTQMIRLLSEIDRLLTDGIEIHPNSPLHETIKKTITRNTPNLNK